MREAWRTGTFSEEGEQKRIGAAAPIFLTLPTLLSSLSTLELVFWVGKMRSLPTQITKCIDQIEKLFPYFLLCVIEYGIAMF